MTLADRARRAAIGAAWFALFVALIPVHRSIVRQERRQREWQDRGVEAEARRGGGGTS